MIDEASPPPSDEPDPEEQLSRLREILGDTDPETLARDVARVLPQAVVKRTQQDKKLSSALYPTVERAMQTSVKKNPKVLIDVIFPVLGPAIRKAIREAMAGLVRAINQNVEYTFTPRGLKWRIEAWRTKRSLGEVILAKSHVFRVEQVFLVHAETGLLLLHVAQPEIDADDSADLISSMLTALQDFMRDSFGMEQGEGLDAFRAGDRIVVVERGPHAVVAAAAHGDPPPELRTALQKATEAIHVQQRTTLGEFDGDVAPFEAARPELEACLLQQKREIQRNLVVPFLLASITVAVLLWLAVSLFNDWRFETRWGEYVDALRDAPGLVVVDEGERDGRTFIVGLRDPYADDPEAFLGATGLESSEFDATWYEFQSTHPDFVVRRVSGLLGLDEGGPVTAQLEYGVLILEGRAQDDLVARALRVPSLLAGVKSVDVSGVVDDALSAIRAYAEQSSTVPVTFAAGQDVPGAAQQTALTNLKSWLRLMDDRAAGEGFVAEVTVVGHAHDEADAEPVSERRARAVLAVVNVGDWKALRFVEAEGRGTAEPLPAERAGANGAANRRVSCVIDVKRKAPSPR